MKMKLCVVMFLAMVIFVAGCGQPLTLNVEPGYSDTILYSKSSTNKIWVEMQGQERKDTGSRVSDLKYEIAREVLSVEPGGGVLVKLTFNKVSIDVTNISGDTEKNNYYTSEVGSTKSSWPGQRGIAGKSITAKIYPDTSVVFQDLDDLRLELRLSATDNANYGALVSEKYLKEVLQRPILISCPKGDISAKSWDEFVATPDPMLNAKAIRKIYSSSGKDSDGNVILKTEIEPLFVLPEGVESAAAGDPFRQVLKDNSDLQDPVVESETIVEVETGIVLSDKLNITYLMLVDGNKLFPDQQRSNSNTDAGMMFIEINIDEKYEIAR